MLNVYKCKVAFIQHVSCQLNWLFLLLLKYSMNWYYPCFVKTFQYCRVQPITVKNKISNVYAKFCPIFDWEKNKLIFIIQLFWYHVVFEYHYKLNFYIETNCTVSFFIYCFVVSFIDQHFFASTRNATMQ